MSSSDESDGEPSTDKDKTHPALVLIDEQTGNKYMRIVSQRGLGEGGEMKWLIKDLHEELKAWGHPGGDNCKITLKSDGEPAVTAVREALAKTHGGIINPEQPPKGEHACNGVVEEAGRTIRDTLRVYKLQLETKLKCDLEIDSPIMQWMARWAAMAISRFRVGKDGNTAYERQRGKRCNEGVVPFGEKVWSDKWTTETGGRDPCNPNGKKVFGWDTAGNPMEHG